MSRRKPEMIDVTVIFKRITDRAVLVNDGDKDIWLPLSQVDYHFCDPEPGDTLELLVPEWLAKEKGML